MAWAALLFAPLAVEPGPVEEAAHLVLLAPLVLVPLFLDAAIPVTFGARPSRLLVAASWLIGPAALAASAAFLVAEGAGAGALVAPWVMATAFVAVWAVRGAADRARTGRLDAAEAVLAAGLAMLPGGALWLLASRAGIGQETYGPLVVLLTAVHFHYAAFALPVWSGLLGRALSGGWAGLRQAHAVLGGGLVVGFWLVAAGIALSRGPAGGSLVETVGVVVFAASAVGTGLLGLVVAPRLGDRAGSLMVAVSGGALVLALVLSVWFNLGARLGLDAPDVVWMLERHGWLNAVGFGLWGALGWRRLRPRPAER